MEITQKLKKVNVWNKKDTQYQPIRALQSIGHDDIPSSPRAMCEGTSCMGSSCGTNCGLGYMVKRKKQLEKCKQCIVISKKERVA